MNILITILLIIAGIIALVLLIALFVKKEYSITRDIVINKSKKEVFNYIRFLKNQDHFNKWVMADPTMKKTFTGVDGTVGFIYAWDGNKKAGAGEQEISAVRDETIDIEVRFLRPFKGIAHSSITTRTITENQTSVQWAFHSGMKYPMNFMLLFIDMEKFLGKDIATSLERLKAVLEKN